jgi:hypothetical protein
MPVTQFRRFRVHLLVGLVVAAVALPVGVLASHQFSDLPDTNPFRNQISNIADAGITSGCAPGKFCPKANVTREQMAAFLNRGLGRAARGTMGGQSVFQHVWHSVGGTRVNVPGAGFLLVNAAVTVFNASGTGCPCTLQLRLGVAGEWSMPFSADIGDNVGEDDTWSYVTIPATGVFPVAAKGWVGATAQVQAISGTTIAFEVEHAAVTALWVPFGDNGQAGP